MFNCRFSLILLLSGLVCAWAVVSRPHPLKRRTPFGTQDGSGVSGNEKGLGIYGGNVTYIEDHPYLVSITFHGAVFCAGVIISKNWVLTTADCLNGYPMDDQAVVAGSRDGLTGTQTYSLNQTYMHPDFNYGYNLDAYGLVQINGTFKWTSKVKKAKLPRHRPKPGTWLTLVGYGNSGSNGVLEAGRIQVLSKEECATIYAGYSNVNLTHSVGCLYNPGKTTICKGDSADPATKNGYVYHLEVAIGDSGYCSSSAMPIITADVYGGMKWIKEVTGLK